MVIYNSITRKDAYVELSTDKGEKHLLPNNSVIFVDDESNFISVKNTGSRKTIGLIPADVYNN